MSHFFLRSITACLIVGCTTLAFANDLFLNKQRQLTFDGKRAGEGYFSPDGRQLIFQSEREPGNPFYQIYILDLESGETHRVSPGTGKTTCAFFQPESDRVIFASTHLDADATQKQEDEFEVRASGHARRYSWDYDENFDIFSVQRDGDTLKRLTKSPGYDAEAAFSPDGKRIVFCTLRDAYPIDELSADDRTRIETDPAYFGEIYIMNADGGKAKRLTTWPGYDGGPFFTPDGEHIVWRHFSDDGATADIYTMKTDGSERLRLTDFASMCWAPYFHPSGDYAIFTTNKHGFENFELYLIDARGTKEPVRVTATDGFDGLPVFSPDGKRLAWTSSRTADRTAQLFIGDWDHAGALAAIGSAPLRGMATTMTSTMVDHTPDPALASMASEIRAQDLRATVDYLASDDLAGRMTGTEGERKAGEYIAARFELAGLRPIGEGGDYYQSFPFTSGIRMVEGENKLRVAGDVTRECEADKDFRPLAFSENGTVEGEVIFAGYGLTAPGDVRKAYNSYAGLDVKDKIVLVFRYVPEDVDMNRRQELNHYAGLRYKAMLARENGAKGLLIAIGPRSPNAGELVPMGFDQSLASSGIPVASIGREVAAALFGGYETSLEDVQEGLDSENPHVSGAFALPGVKVKLTTSIERETKNGRNVIGYLPPGDNAKDAPVVVLGAHYDHIGHGEIGSLARSGEEGQIHNGADDNASGTSTVLELASALAAERTAHPERFKAGILIAAWSGEELGLIGSNHFVAHPPLDWSRVAAYLNFDMVGRLRENKLILQGVGSSDAWKGLIEKRNVSVGFNLELHDDPYLPTDVTAFYPHKVPVLAFFTGSHEDYNRPTDDAATLNYEGMERITNMAFALTMDLVASETRPSYVLVERSTEDTGSRASLRAYLGTIPDYASADVEGVKLSGVRAGGPAEKAGLAGGDVIVAFAGRDIKNIYDYTYALDAIKIGEPVEVIVVRDGERVTLTVVPEARK